ncbi:hypothetical protein QFZ96_002176 [Paraburkholderia youngii]
MGIVMESGDPAWKGTSSLADCRERQKCPHSENSIVKQWL